MKKELIAELFEKFENACYILNGIECWSARDLQEILNYSKWDNFLNVIDKAKNACLNAGAKIPDHFADVGKMILIGKGGRREVDERGFAIIRSKGDKALFGGFNTLMMKRMLNVPENRPLADFLPTLTIKAKDFASELTSHNVIEKDLKGYNQISDEHVENNLAVRKILNERGVQPEKLPPAEDVKKIQRKLESDEKKVYKDIKEIEKNK